jgi:hypothetical protein
VTPNVHSIPNDRFAIGRFDHHAHDDRRDHHRHFFAPGFAFGSVAGPFYSYSYDYGPYGYDDDCEMIPQSAQESMYCENYRGEMEDY